MTLTQGCSGLNFQTFWLVAGTWTWGGISEGTAFFIERTISLKGNADGTFRGLTIGINESAPYGTTMTGVATGELPLDRSPSGPWQTISDEPVTLVRQ